MDIFIDIECLKSFVHSPKNEDFCECERLLKRHLHLMFNFAKNSMDDYLKTWYNRLSDGRGESEDKDEWNVGFPQRPLNQINDLDLLSVYLLDCDDNAVDLFKDSVIVGNQRIVIETLKKLFVDNSFELNKKIPMAKFGWKNISDVVLPCTDIVIADRYFFSKKECFKENYGKLFSLIATQISHPLNIVIFFGDENGNTTDSDIITYMSAIKSQFAKHSNITFIQYGKENNPHDRCIVTNYKSFHCGDSWSNLFDKKGCCNSKGFCVEKASLAKYDEFLLLKTIRTILQNIIKNSDRIVGDRKSNFFKFSNV